MAVWRRPGLLRQSSPGVPSDLVVCPRVLARTGRMNCRRHCASFPPSLDSTAISMFCVARLRSARGMIAWMCTQERWNPEVDIIFRAALRYRRTTAGSSLDDAHPDNSTLHTGAVRPHTGFVESHFFISPRTRIWCTRWLGRLNLLDILLRHNALVSGHPGPRKKNR
jgi:hypothetical protein